MKLLLNFGEPFQRYPSHLEKFEKIVQAIQELLDMLQELLEEVHSSCRKISNLRYENLQSLVELKFEKTYLKESGEHVLKKYTAFLKRAFSLIAREARRTFPTVVRPKEVQGMIYRGFQNLTETIRITCSK